MSKHYSNVITNEKDIGAYNEIGFMTENWEFIKPIVKYTKDTFIKWNLINGNIELMGQIAHNIYGEGLSKEIEEEEFFSIFKKESYNLLKTIKVNKLKPGECKKFLLTMKDKNSKDIVFKLLLKENYKEDFYIGILNDITLEKKIKDDYDYMLEYDLVTETPSKIQMEKLVNTYLLENEKKEELAELYLIDIDNFKCINDIFNHEIGDRLLILIANKLKNILGEKDIICRYSGDEFIIFRYNIPKANYVRNFADKIMEVFNNPFNIGGEEISLTASIGIAISPYNGVDFYSLLRRADSAVYVSKSNGKNRYTFFEEKISTAIKRFYSLDKGLKKALKKNEFFVVFQPSVDILNNNIRGMEALLRWNSKELGLVSPNEIISIAESNKMIIPIGKFVLEEVFKKAKELILEGFDNFKIAVNLSEIQMHHGIIIKDFTELIEKYNISPKYIEVEITESILMKSFDKNVKILNEIKKLGANIALDDFGTGYSSLNYLTKLPIDTLKIDRSFIKDIMNDFKGQCVVENIIELSHKLGIKVIAEGVEDRDQALYLKDINCDIIQGYYFSKPTSFGKIKEMINKKFYI